MGVGKALARREQRSLLRGPSGNVGLSGNSFLGDSGFERFDRSLGEAAARVPVVWACVRERTSRLSAMSVQGPDGLLPVWMTAPNTPPEKGYIGFLSSMDMLSQAGFSFDVHGNIFFGVIRTAKGRMHELMVLDPDYIQIELDASRGRYRIWHTYFDGEIVVVPNMMLPQYPVGVSLVYYQAQLLGMSKTGQTHVSSMLQNGGVTPFVISTKGSTTVNQKREFSYYWRKLQGGARNSGVPALLDGEATVHNVGTTPAERQLLESRQFTDTQICALFGVDPSLVGLNTSGSSLTYQNLQQRESAVLVGMRSLIRKLEYVFTWLNGGRQVKLIYHDVVPDETKARTFEALARVGQMTGRMVMTPEEMRSELGLPPPVDGACEPVPMSEKADKLALMEGAA